MKILCRETKWQRLDFRRLRCIFRHSVFLVIVYIQSVRASIPGYGLTQAVFQDWQLLIRIEPGMDNESGSIVNYGNQKDLLLFPARPNGEIRAVLDIRLPKLTAVRFDKASGRQTFPGVDPHLSAAESSIGHSSL